jgi:hypothetical protein
MSLVDRKLEQQRFNEITSDHAKSLAEECEGQPPAMRSCWNCNGAHHNLKKPHFVFTCFGCGITYVSGVPAVILGMRMRGEDVTDAVMDKYEEAAQEDL